MFTIKVTVPQTGQFVQWTSSDFYRLKEQAKLEHKRGARVQILNDAGIIIYCRPTRRTTTQIEKRKKWRRRHGFGRNAKKRPQAEQGAL